MPTVIVQGNNLMQPNYSYELIEPVGKNYHPETRPELIPEEILELGVIGGKYMTNCKNEFPVEWLKNAKLCFELHAPDLFFLELMRHNPYLCGKRKSGSMRKIQVVGSSGITDITSGDAVEMMNVRSRGGRGCAGISTRSKETASRQI